MGAAAPAITPVGPIRGYADYYLAAMRIGISTQFQYRVANYFFLVAHIAEPIIYLVVWSTVAVQQGGEVGGFTPSAFAAYYIVWTLVRTMNITSVGAWEGHIREGDLSRMLLHPIHPVHWDLAYFAGWKVVMIVLWLPIAVVLSLLFRPEFHIEPIDAAVFAVAIWGAYFVRALMYSNLGMAAFWTTRLGPIIQVVMTFELLFSGPARAAVADAGVGAASGGRPAVQVDVRLSDRSADRPAAALRAAGRTRDAGPVDRDRGDRHPAALAGRRTPLRRGRRLT